MTAKQVATSPGNRSEHLDDPQAARVQTALQLQSTNSSCPLVSGKLVTGLKMANGVAQDIAHGLGRAYKGYLVASVSSASAISAPTPPSSLDTTKFIRLQSNADITATVWIF